METGERAEVRDMIHGILAGWNARTEAYMVTTNASLNEVNKHFENLNGSVARHEKIINQNIPHTIAQCPQVDNIKELRDNMVSTKTMNGFVWKIIAAMGVLFTIGFGFIELGTKMGWI